MSNGIDFGNHKKNRDLSRDSSNKRRRTPEEFYELCKKEGDPCMMVKIYNHREKTVLEALKNQRTKRLHAMKLRRPHQSEEDEYGKMLTQQQLVSGKQVREQLEIITGEYNPTTVIEISLGANDGSTNT